MRARAVSTHMQLSLRFVNDLHSATTSRWKRWNEVLPVDGLTLCSRFLHAFPRKVCTRLMAPRRTDIAWRRSDLAVRCHGRQLIPPVRLPYRKEINARRSWSRDLRIVYYHAVLRNPFPTARRALARTVVLNKHSQILLDFLWLWQDIKTRKHNC